MKMMKIMKMMKMMKMTNMMKMMTMMIVFSFSISYWESHTYKTKRLIHIAIFVKGDKLVHMRPQMVWAKASPHHYVIFLTPS